MIDRITEKHTQQIYTHEHTNIRKKTTNVKSHQQNKNGLCILCVFFSYTIYISHMKLKKTNTENKE